MTLPDRSLAPDTDFVYDAETYINMFSIGFEHVRTGNRWEFEVSPRISQVEIFLQFIEWMKSAGVRGFGFNNEAFDYAVIHHLHNLAMTTGSFTAYDAYMKAQEIIGTDWSQRFSHMVWANQRHFIQGDLLKIHHFDNVARATSLKKLEINMQSEYVIDLPYDPHTELNTDQADHVKRYMWHDIAESVKFYLYSLDQIKFRDDLAAKYPDLGDVLNFNDTKIGKKFFERQLEMKRPGSCYTRDANNRRKPRQTHRPTINLGEVISPKVWFNTPEFQQIVERLRASVIVETKGVFEDMVAHVGGIDFTFGLGGMHGSVTAQTVRADDEFDLIDIDVASYYPNLAISNGYYPEHLSTDFCEIYQEVYEMRQQYSKKTAENAMLKLALNGVYGDSGNAYSPFYDPKYMMSITINGQLMICMLAEWAMAAGGRMVQVNTDGITCLVPKDRRGEFEAACDAWEDHTGLVLEHVDYDAMHIRDVNSYMAEKTDGSVKRIGAYGYETPMENPYTRELGWHKDHSSRVVAMAAEAKLVRGTDIATFIKAHRNPFDFMITIKVPKTFRLEERRDDGTINRVQPTSRYYVSTAGHALAKVMPPLKGKPNERVNSVEKGWRVKVVNDASVFDWNDVNWLYYIEQAKKLTSWVN